MSEPEQRNWGGVGALLGRLVRDTRANTLALMAAAVIPLAGMVGGGVDISRMYIVKTRLQHACDAGALAGRKMMGGGTWSQSSYAPRTEAERFFDANYQSDGYGATNRQRSFTETGGKVTGTASAVVPMTLMRIFGKTSETLTVTCDADMRLPNTDIMFVLDVTGSMADKAVSTDTVTKIQGLRTAVKCFYEIVARLNTAETCVGGDPSGGTGDQVQIRFGFVPYSTNVNVGKLLPTAYFADSWPYQSREPTMKDETQPVTGSASVTSTQITNATASGNWSNQSTTSNNQSQCNALADPADSNHTLTGSEGSAYDQAQSGTAPNPVTYTWKTNQSGWYYAWQYIWSNNKCRLQRRTYNYTWVRNYQRTDTYTTTQVFDRYRYAQITKDISGLKNGTAWNTSFQSNVGTAGAMQTISWDGCIEERTTVRTTDFDPIPDDANDLDIDLVPSESDPTSLWGPALPGFIYTRQLQSGGWGGYSGSQTTAESLTTTNYANASQYYCPREARKLQAWTTASTFEAYVDSLSPTGNTYHDIGLLWGARFASPTGIFADENDYTPEGGEIERHMIFMTDGEACTGTLNYTAYGIPWYDRRQTSESTAPTDGCLTTGTLTEQVNLRTAALCTAIKNKNITLWVIWFGVSSPTIEGMLTSCATSGRFFTARNSTELQTTFRSIADQISQLRLTR